MLKTCGGDVLVFSQEEVVETPPVSILPTLESAEGTRSDGEHPDGKDPKTSHKEKKEQKDKYAKPKIKTLVPNSSENNLTKARTFSFEQLYEFNNLFLNKSFLRKRVRASEVDIDKNQTDIAELFKWKE